MFVCACVCVQARAYLPCVCIFVYTYMLLSACACECREHVQETQGDVPGVSLLAGTECMCESVYVCFRVDKLAQGEVAGTVMPSVSMNERLALSRVGASLAAT